MAAADTMYNIAWCDVRFRNEVLNTPNVLRAVPAMPAHVVPHVDALGRTNIGFPGGIVLTPCLFVDPGRKPAAMTDKGAADDGIQREYQWNRNQGVVGAAKDRHTAQRLFFFLHPSFGPAGVCTVSHLCHRNACMNPRHMTVESLPVNKGRNGCAGGICCQHIVRCLMPGPAIY